MSERDPYAEFDPYKGGEYKPAAPSGDDPYAAFVEPTRIDAAAKPDRLSGTAPGDPLLDRVLRGASDFSRAAVNSGTFGLSDKLMGLIKPDTERLTAEARTRSPLLSLAGDVAGMAGPGGVGSHLVGKAIPKLAGTGLAAIAGNQAITGGLLAGADDVAHGNLPDPIKAAESAAIGGVAGPIIAGVSRAVSPVARARAAGTGLGEGEKDAITAFLERARGVGIPVTLPEAAAEAIPGRAARLEAAYNTAVTSPQGSQVATNFDAARVQRMGDVARGIANDLGPGAEGYATSQHAKEAVQTAKDLVKNSAEPYYTSSADTRLPATPSSPAIAEARDQVRDNTVKMGALRNYPPNSIKFLDTVKKQMDTNVTKAIETDPYLASLIAKDAETLTTAMDKAHPDYATGRQIWETGKQDLVEPLKAGPLGTISRTAKPSAQANALFSAATPEAEDAAILAVKRLAAQGGDNVPRGLLSTRVSEAASKDPLTFGRRALPTPEARNVARTIAPENNAVQDAIDVARAVNPKGGNPQAGDTGAGGPFGEGWRTIRDLGRGKVASLLQDPTFASKLGDIGPLQQLLQSLGTATGERAADADPLTINVRPSRRRRGG